MTISRRNFIGLTAGAVMGAPFIGRAQQAPSSEPNIMFIVMDTTRADRCSCLGYGRETTPFLRALAAESRLYTQCHSTSAWTVPSHASMFTGQYQCAHGAGMGKQGLSRRSATLAAIFKSRRYKTIGIIENSMLRRDLGFDNGFERYHEGFRVAGKPYGQIALEILRAQITAERFASSPFFCFVNLISPHSPYEPPAAVREELYPELERDRGSNAWREWYLGKRPTDEQVVELNALYDAELRYTDDVVAQMVQHLKDQGFWDNTVLVIVADHGENIGDHGHMDHVFCLYETLTHVPMLIHDPAHLPPGVDARPVQVHDLFPTLLQRVGIDAAKYPHHGIDLTGSIPPDRMLLMEYPYPVQTIGMFGARQFNAKLKPYRRTLRAVRKGTDKYIWSSDGQHEFYDLAKDSGELSNLIANEEKKEVIASLDGALHAAVQHYQPEGGPVEEDQPADLGLDEEEREALEKLGYL